VFVDLEQDRKKELIQLCFNRISEL